MRYREQRVQRENLLRALPCQRAERVAGSNESMGHYGLAVSYGSSSYIRPYTAMNKEKALSAFLR